MSKSKKKKVPQKSQNSPRYNKQVMLLVCKCMLNNMDINEALKQHNLSKAERHTFVGYWNRLVHKDRSYIRWELDLLEVGEANETFLQNRKAFRDYLNDNDLLTVEDIFRAYKEPVDAQAFSYYLFNFTCARLRQLPIDYPIRKIVYSPFCHDASFFEEKADVNSLVSISVRHKTEQKRTKNPIDIAVLYEQFSPYCDKLKLVEYLLSMYYNKEEKHVQEQKEKAKQKEAQKKPVTATSFYETGADNSWERLKVHLKKAIGKGPRKPRALLLFRRYKNSCDPIKLARFLSICLLDGRPSELEIQNQMKLFLPDKEEKKPAAQKKQVPSLFPKVDMQTREMTIPWDAIVFSDTYVRFMDFRFNGHQVLTGQHYFSYPCLQSRASYNYIKPHFANRLPQIKAMVQGYQVVGVISKLDLLKAIRMLKSQEDADDWDVEESELRPSHSFDFAIQYDKDKMMRRLRALKSACINKLIDKQEKAKRIVPCKELLSHTDADTEEDAFIFTIKAESPRQVAIIFENVNESRATLKFVARKEKYEEALRCVYNFMTSNKINKRQLLQYGRIDFQRHGILYYRCINHTTVNEWAGKIQPTFHTYFTCL